MLTFWIICALMILFTLWFVLPPLFQGKAETKPDESGAANLLVYQDQHRELEADLKNGLLTDAQYQQDKEELERRLLAEVADEKQAHSRWVATRKLGYALAVAIPVAAIVFYFVVGNPRAIEDQRSAPPNSINR
jgi:cytochrome c-type biogenesis protein CcmH